VSRAESVVFGFFAPQKSGKPAVLFDGMKLVAPAGQNFMRVSLMPDIPDQTVVRRVENVMHRHGKFDRAETCARMTADARSRFQNKRRTSSATSCKSSTRNCRKSFGEFISDKNLISEINFSS
jgi:hypothetical protein